MITQAISAFKKKVKNLLLTGKSETVVAKQLKLTLSNVKKLKKEIEKDKRTWNKKEKILDPYYQTIYNWMQEDWEITKIHLHLLHKNVKVSYPTVSRFVTEIDKKERISKIITEPGYEAKIFLIPAGKFNDKGKKQRVWIFMMKLSYSKHRYCEEITAVNFKSFLQCNINAFAFFNAVPRFIKVNTILGLNLNEPTLNKRYVKFLEKLGSRLFSKSKRNCFINCPTEVRMVKEQFLFPIMHKDYDRFITNLKHWSLKVNLGIHPFTKKVIEKEFIKNEKPNMLPFNTKNSKTKSKKLTKKK